MGISIEPKGDVVEELLQELERREGDFRISYDFDWICFAKDWNSNGQGVVVMADGKLKKANYELEGEKQTFWKTREGVEIDLSFWQRRRLKKLYGRVVKLTKRNRKISRAKEALEVLR